MATVGQKNAPKGGRIRFETIPIGATAYGSTGTNTTLVAGTIYWAEVFLARPTTLKGVAVLNGATVGTDKGIVGLWDTNGNLVSNSAVAGATTSGANAFQAYDFTAVTPVLPAGQYFVGYQSNGTTDTLRTIAVSTYIAGMTSSASGAFGTLTNMASIPITVTADKGPVAYAYAA